MDWSAIGGLVGQAAPTIGGLLGGLVPFPGGAILGEMAGKVIAEALGVPPTPEAVGRAIETGDPAVINAKLQEAEARMNAEVEKHKADLQAVQDAREYNLALDKRGSKLAYAPTIVSGIILLGFTILSYLAMKPDVAGVRTDVTLFLLGAWSGYAGAVVQYWLGSSSGSAVKDDRIAALSAVKTPTSAKPLLPKR